MKGSIIAMIGTAVAAVGTILFILIKKKKEVNNFQT